MYIYGFVKTSKSYRVIKQLLLDIFTFQVKSYNPSFEKMLVECSKILNADYKLEVFGAGKELTWYPLYKFAKSVLKHNNIESKADSFLAKYNMYRSFAFIFLFHTMLVIVMHSNNQLVETDLFSFQLVLIIDFAMWYTFHSKYKRYWILCGNEVINSLYFYLNSDTLINNRRSCDE